MKGRSLRVPALKVRQHGLRHHAEVHGLVAHLAARHARQIKKIVYELALETSRPSSVSIGLRLISTGNSLPSLRRP
jgi:hypothetical protein